MKAQGGGGNKKKLNLTKKTGVLLKDIFSKGASKCPWKK